MADVYEKDLAAKSSLTTSDYIRVVGSDNVSYKQLVSAVAKINIENYTGSSLGGSSRSIKSAIDAIQTQADKVVYADLAQKIRVSTNGDGTSSSIRIYWNNSDFFALNINGASDSTTALQLRTCINGTWTTIWTINRP